MASASAVGMSGSVPPPSSGVAGGRGELVGADRPRGNTNQTRGSTDAGQALVSSVRRRGALSLCALVSIYLCLLQTKVVLAEKKKIKCIHLFRNV